MFQEARNIHFEYVDNRRFNQISQSKNVDGRGKDDSLGDAAARLHTVVESQDVDDGDKDELLGDVKGTTSKDLHNMAQAGIDEIKKVVTNSLSLEEERGIKQDMAQIFDACSLEVSPVEELSDEAIHELVTKLKLDITNFVDSEKEARLVEYFGLSDKYEDLQEKMQHFNLNMAKTLATYQTFIKEDLKWLKGSVLTRKEHQNLISNAKLSIQQGILDLPEVMDQEIAKKGERYHEPWEVNRDMIDNLSGVNDTLRSSAKFLVRMTNPGGREEMYANYDKLKGPDQKTNADVYRLVLESKTRLRKIKRALTRKAYSEEEIKAGALERRLYTMPTSVDALFPGGTEFDIDFLSKADREIEDQISSIELVIGMTEIGADFTPASLLVAFNDMYNVGSDEDSSLQLAKLLAKEAGLPADRVDAYTRDKTFFDRGMYMAGVVPFVPGGLAKTIRAGKRMRQFDPGVIEGVLSRLPIPSDLKSSVTNNLKRRWAGVEPTPLPVDTGDVARAMEESFTSKPLSKGEPKRYRPCEKAVVLTTNGGTQIGRIEKKGDKYFIESVDKQHRYEINEHVLLWGTYLDENHGTTSFADGVSYEHLSIQRVGDDIVITDNNSGNGTTFTGFEMKPVSKQADAKVEDAARVMQEFFMAKPLSKGEPKRYRPCEKAVVLTTNGGTQIGRIEKKGDKYFIESVDKQHRYEINEHVLLWGTYLDKNHGTTSFVDGVSYEHLSIQRVGDDIVITDNNSGNGTTVVGYEIKPVTRQADSRMDDIAPRQPDDVNARQPERVSSVARRNTSLKEWHEVHRESDVVSIGDLNGSMSDWAANRAHLESMGMLDQSGNWTGGNQRLVLLGDIMADRSTQGLDIMRDLRSLRRQAREAGGDVVIIAGNHDDFAISFLIGRKTAGGWSPLDVCMHDSQGAGLLEFKRFGSPELQRRDMDRFSTWDQMQREREMMLQNMRNNPEGREILEQMCDLRLVEQVDDVLYVHTNPTENMMQMVASRGVDEINDIYQQGLRDVLIHGRNPSSGFDAIRDMFLNTNNRSNFVNPHLAEQLRARGINQIVHGHNGEGGTVTNVSGLSILDNDYGGAGAVTRVGTDGSMTSGDYQDRIR